VQRKADGVTFQPKFPHFDSSWFARFTVETPGLLNRWQA
jgi:hypothetical protein